MDAWRTRRCGVNRRLSGRHRAVGRRSGGCGEPRPRGSQTPDPPHRDDGELRRRRAGLHLDFNGPHHDEHHHDHDNDHDNDDLDHPHHDDVHNDFDHDHDHASHHDHFFSAGHDPAADHNQAAIDRAGGDRDASEDGRASGSSHL